MSWPNELVAHSQLCQRCCLGMLVHNEKRFSRWLRLSILKQLNCGPILRSRQSSIQLATFLLIVNLPRIRQRLWKQPVCDNLPKSRPAIFHHGRGSSSCQPPRINHSLRISSPQQTSHFWLVCFAVRNRGHRQQPNGSIPLRSFYEQFRISIFVETCHCGRCCSVQFYCLHESPLVVQFAVVIDMPFLNTPLDFARYVVVSRRIPSRVCHDLRGRLCNDDGFQDRELSVLIVSS